MSFKQESLELYDSADILKSDVTNQLEDGWKMGAYMFVRKPEKEVHILTGKPQLRRKAEAICPWSALERQWWWLAWCQMPAFTVLLSHWETEQPAGPLRLCRSPRTGTECVPTVSECSSWYREMGEQRSSHIMCMSIQHLCSFHWSLEVMIIETFSRVS